ncbi:MAG: LCP family protein [Anaerolineales bacterium]|nr:LCP family protein [Anaerolineales bacterium]
MMTSRKRLLWILLIPSLILACVSPGLVGAIPANIEDSNPQATAAKAALVTVPPDATPTPTPFLPVPPTPTYIPTAFPTPEPTATPKPEVDTQPVSGGDTSPADLINYPQDQINILLLGSDQRVGEIGFRTDTIILLSINTRNKTASMVSFPRDLYIYIPGYTYNRINTVMYYGGFPLMTQTLQHNFGVRVDHYILVGLNAFIETIDSLGGINVQVGEKLTDQRTGHGYYTVKPGQVLMSGADALWYVRSRYTTSDFDRTRRQQEVIQALGDRLLSMNALESADELYDIYSKYVSSDMKWIDIAPMVPLAAQIGDPDDIQRYAIGRGHVIPWTTPGGAQVLLPQEGAIISMLRQAVGVP